MFIDLAPGVHAERIETDFGARIAWAQATDSRPDRTQRRTLSRGLLQALLPEGSLRPTSLSQQYPQCGSTDHGPLSFDAAGAPLVSVSYTTGWVVVGVAPAGATAFGIDAELDTAQRRAAAAEALDAPNSAEVLRVWTRLEAAAKARGQGLRGDWERPDPTLVFNELTLPVAPGAIALSVALSLG